MVGNDVNASEAALMQKAHISQICASLIVSVLVDIFVCWKMYGLKLGMYVCIINENGFKSSWKHSFIVLYDLKLE